MLLERQKKVEEEQRKIKEELAKLNDQDAQPLLSAVPPNLDMAGLFSALPKADSTSSTVSFGRGRAPSSSIGMPTNIKMGAQSSDQNFSMTRSSEHSLPSTSSVPVGRGRTPSPAFSVSSQG